QALLRAYDAELIALRIGEHRPGLLAGLADVRPPGAEPDDPFDLGLAVLRIGIEVEVQPVLDVFSSVTGMKQSPIGASRSGPTTISRSRSDTICQSSTAAQNRARRGRSW